MGQRYEQVVAAMIAHASMSLIEPVDVQALGARVGVPIVRLPASSAPAIPFEYWLLARGNGWTVALRGDQGERETRWAAAQGLAHALGVDTNADADECRRLASTIAAPMPAVEHALRMHGPSVSKLADHFLLPEPVAAMRLSHLLARPFAYTAPPRSSRNVADIA